MSMRSCRPAPTLDRPLNGAAPHIICGKKRKKRGILELKRREADRTRGREMEKMREEE
jgi:hypothetical protein